MTKKKEKLYEKPNYITLKFFRYMANVPVDVFKQLQKHFSYSVVQEVLGDFLDIQL